MLNQSLNVDVLEWHHPIARVRRRKKRERVGHPPVESPDKRPYTLAIDILVEKEVIPEVHDKLIDL